MIGTIATNPELIPKPTRYQCHFLHPFAFHAKRNETQPSLRLTPDNDKLDIVAVTVPPITQKRGEIYVRDKHTNEIRRISIGDCVERFQAITDT
ncbi:hypothetical protein CA13_70240 [Planctomycetes bacterium CA13]|uniref:Uncharacterized protein n=1 Tax=Novipirellula herctigrandis TaxID=2527986 RepID=A0A5C5YNX7_9BACT|nr:hypothetical protein CA13_70240 [Planctomycetes bacterium CA13]